MALRSRYLKAFAGDAAGNVLPIAAGGLIVAAALVGGGIDMSRAYLVKNRLQAACDAGVLAGRRAVTNGGFDSAARSRAETYFATNFDSAGNDSRDTTFIAVGEDSGNTINATATSKIDTTLMRITGTDEFALSVACTASMGVGNSDVLMVLDTTGSMSWTLPGGSVSRIEALRSAMKNFYDTVAGATTATSARIRYGFVPYSSSVNVGQLIYNLDPEFLADSHPVQSREAVFTAGSPAVFDHWDYKQVTYDTSAYKTFASVTTQTGDDGDAVSSVWQGCIEERETTPASSFSFLPLVGITPGTADLDIDTPPDSTPASKWAPMWPEVAFARYEYYNAGGRTRSRYTNNTTPDGFQVNSYCPAAARTFAEMTEGDFDAYADALVPRGNTYHDIGILWGARLISREGIFAANVNDEPDNGGSVSRHLVFMTDGEMATNYEIQTTYGIEIHDQRVTDDGSSDNNARHTSRFRAICEAVKAKGVRLWVIAFGSSLTSDLSGCASSGSAFRAASASQLNTAFQEIAQQVGELRVVQ